MATVESNQHEDDLKIQMKLSHNLGFLDKKEKLIFLLRLLTAFGIRYIFGFM